MNTHPLFTGTMRQRAGGERRGPKCGKPQKKMTKKTEKREKKDMKKKKKEGCLANLLSGI